MERDEVRAMIRGSPKWKRYDFSKGARSARLEMLDRRSRVHSLSVMQRLENACGAIISLKVRQTRRNLR